jgi:hypothetical protein
MFHGSLNGFYRPTLKKSLNEKPLAVADDFYISTLISLSNLRVASTLKVFDLRVYFFSS